MATFNVSRATVSHALRKPVPAACVDQRDLPPPGGDSELEARRGGWATRGASCTRAGTRWAVSWPGGRAAPTVLSPDERRGCWRGAASQPQGAVLHGDRAPDDHRRGGFCAFVAIPSVVRLR